MRDDGPVAGPTRPVPDRRCWIGCAWPPQVSTAADCETADGRTAAAQRPVGAVWWCRSPELLAEEARQGRRGGVVAGMRCACGTLGAGRGERQRIVR